MTYASTADLIAKYGALHLAKLTNTDPSDDTPDNDRLILALEEATAEIDGYLTKCFEIPLVDPVPDVIRFKAIALARYHLESGCECSEKVQQQYDQSIEWLKELCCGDCPQEIPGLTKKSDRSESISYCTQPRVFTRENLRGYTEFDYPYSRSGRDRNYKY